MVTFLFAALLLALSIAAVVVRKTYYYLPLRELKRQAAKKDPLAQEIYRAVSYGDSLRGLLGIFIVLTGAAGFVLLARVAPVWLSLIGVVVLLWAAVSWLPSTRLTSIGARMTMAVTPTIVWVLEHGYPLLGRLVGFATKRYTVGRHTGLYERGDLLELIEKQQKQVDNRLRPEELEIAKRALSFDGFKVGDVLTPKQSIKIALADDTVGPILIDELHQGDGDYILVRESSKGPFVGTLEVSQLGIKSSGHIHDLMDDRVYYVHEDDILSDAVHAFFVTNHAIFIVVNSSEEYKGVITVETILRQLLGHIPGDEFDQYADIAAVAARHPKHQPTKD